jgi:hypothetical protein
MDNVLNEDLKRIETKVDKLTDAVTRLILVEERQTAQGVRIGALENKSVELDRDIREVDRKVDRWVNMGVGAWALLATVYALAELVVKVQH